MTRGKDDRLAKRLLATFLTELAEHSRNLERGLLALETAVAGATGGAADPASLEMLFRTAHSLKGAARSVNVELVEACCHRLEELFGAAQRGTLPVNASFIDAALAAADAIRDAGLRLAVGEELTSGPIAEAVRRLAALAGGPQAPGHAMPSDVAPQSAASGAVDRDAVVRIATDRLDALVKKSAVLLLLSKRPRARLGDVAQASELLRQWRQEFAARSKGSSRPEDGAGSRRTPDVQKNFRRLERDLQQLAARLGEELHQLELSAAQIELDVRNLRMLPFSEACEGLPRAVRDLATSLGKHATLAINGSDVEIDRQILQRLKDPLLHLVRNAVHHGIEKPEVRAAAGKPSHGTVTVGARLLGGTIEISIGDDGCGLDFAAIREHARAHAPVEPVDEGGLIQSIFLSGFSTAADITRISGRGIGLHVVKTEVEKMRGMVAVESVANQGACFTLSLPLSLSTIRALLVGVAGTIFAIDSFLVQRIMRVAASELQSMEGRTVVQLENAAVPVGTLASAINMEPQERQDGGSKLCVVVLSSVQGRAAVVVDELIAETEIVVQPLDSRLDRPTAISAATVLSDGSIALVLNPAEVIAAIRTSELAQSLQTAEPNQSGQQRRGTILVVDDSLTTRMLEQNILESAGYEVLLAADGTEAWQILQDNTGIGLVVSDIEMPGMNGFALTENIRRSRRLSRLPVVLVTALEDQQDRVKGLAAGADAYLVKSAFDHEALIKTVERML